MKSFSSMDRHNTVSVHSICLFGLSYTFFRNYLYKTYPIWESCWSMSSVCTVILILLVCDDFAMISDDLVIVNTTSPVISLSKNIFNFYALDSSISPKIWKPTNDGKYFIGEKSVREQESELQCLIDISESQFYNLTCVCNRCNEVMCSRFIFVGLLVLVKLIYGRPEVTIPRYWRPQPIKIFFGKTERLNLQRY